MSFRQIKSFDLLDIDIDEENRESYQELAKDAKLLQEIFSDINKLVYDSRKPLEVAENITENTIQNIERGNTELTKAANTSKIKNTILFITFSTIIGGCMGGPLGGGAVLGITSALGGYLTAGSIVGGAAVGALTGAGAFGGGSGLLLKLCKKKSN